MISHSITIVSWNPPPLFQKGAKQGGGSKKDQIPHLKMLIIGGTPDDCTTYEAMLKQRVNAEGLSTTIIFTGHVSDMPAVYNGLDVVVSASTSPEPLGTVVIESMALGRPLIGPNHGGAAEMMQHQSTGLLFEHGSATALAQQIQQLHQQPELAQTLGANARRHALATFAVATHVEHMQNLYAQLLETKGDIKNHQTNENDVVKPLHQRADK